MVCAETDEAVAVKPAELDPARTVTAVGTARLPLLLVRETTAPPDRAAEVRVTVHVEVPAPVIVVGVHDSAFNWGVAGWTVTVVVILGLPEAVMVTGWLAVTEPAVAVKGALVELAGIVTEAGTVRAALLAPNVTG